MTEFKDAGERQANQLVLQRRHIHLVPEYQPLLQRPQAYPQRAKVVGPEDEEIYVDEWGGSKSVFCSLVRMTMLTMVAQAAMTVIQIQPG